MNISDVCYFLGALPRVVQCVYDVLRRCECI